MTKKAKQRRLNEFCRLVHKTGGNISYHEAFMLMGGKMIKNARRKGLLICNPDPHTGRMRKDERSGKVRMHWREMTPTPKRVWLSPAGKARVAKSLPSA